MYALFILVFHTSIIYIYIYIYIYTNEVARLRRRKRETQNREREKKRWETESANFFWRLKKNGKSAEKLLRNYIIFACEWLFCMSVTYSHAQSQRVGICVCLHNVSSLALFCLYGKYTYVLLECFAHSLKRKLFHFFFSVLTRFFKIHMHSN